MLKAVKTEKDALAGIKQEGKENPGVGLSRLLGEKMWLEAILEDAQIIRRYDQLLNALKTEKDALAGIKQEAKENPGVDLSRLLGEKEVTVRMINQDLMKYEQIVHDMKMGSGLKGRMAELKRRIGV